MSTKLPPSGSLPKMLWILCGWTIAKLETFLLREAYEDHRNSPYSIVDRVRVNVSSDDKGLKCYQLPQEEVDRIERMLKGGNDSDIESDDESVGKEPASQDEIDDHPRRVSCNTRSGRAATRLSLT